MRLGRLVRRERASDPQRHHAVGGLLAGTVLVEAVFAIPGVGRMMVDAVVARDFPMVQGGVLVVAVLFVTVNVLTDLTAALLDPRVRV